jgi:methionyl-tRNA formyltransferase
MRWPRCTAPAPPPERILILSDAESWINGELLDLIMDWSEQGHEVYWGHDTAEAASRYDQGHGADFCLCLSFGQIVPTTLRAGFRHTLVVHESDLPKGKGWSPLTWQIIEGRNRIPITLFEAADRVDSGPIYAQHWIEFEGHELIDELRSAQAAATLKLCRWFIDAYPASAAQAQPQQGTESVYPRRRPADSQLDPDLSIAQQFNQLRVVDNERYPAFFDWRGQRYRLSITRT